MEINKIILLNNSIRNLENLDAKHLRALENEDLNLKGLIGFFSTTRGFLVDQDAD
jgi:hypothetical protein